MTRTLLLSLALAIPLLAADKPAPPADLTAPPADALKTDSGVLMVRISPGTGAVKPRPDSIVNMRFTVWKEDGTLVQHVPAPQVVMLPVAKMIPGWGEAVQHMVIGEKQRVWVPASLTGGKSPLGMVIDTELVEIYDAPVAPPDVAAIPADATTTESGLAYRVLRPGTGTAPPTRRNRVVVHYSGWTTDGVLFDSSLKRGTPADFALTEVIRGWTEGLQLMVEGERRRFWIPSRLAYGKQKGMPQGMLVFDIELIDIK